jgi:hypothetical protein
MNKIQNDEETPTFPVPGTLTGRSYRVLGVSPELKFISSFIKMKISEAADMAGETL